MHVCVRVWFLFVRMGLKNVSQRNLRVGHSVHCRVMDNCEGGLQLLHCRNNSLETQFDSRERRDFQQAGAAVVNCTSAF